MFEVAGEGRVELQIGAASVGMDRMSNFRGLNCWTV